MPALALPHALAGNPSFLSGRAWSTAAPGETVVVPAGARHAYRNRGGETAHLVCHAKPPSTLQEFLEETAELSRAREITRLGLPTGFGALRDGLSLAKRHREMVVLLFPPMPPRFVQRLLFGRK
jgi:hypothetical protein